MNQALGIIAALPGELAPLVRGWTKLPRRGTTQAWQAPGSARTCVAVCSGMGSGAATRSFAALREWISPNKVVSVGWAGALSSELGIGSICRPGCIVEERTGERFAVPGNGPVLVTLDLVANEREKRRLHAAYGAIAVDMEAATLARLAAAAGYGFGCIKAISDKADAVLPDLNPYVTAGGQFAMTRFVGHILPRPQHWAALVRFGRNASLAAEKLSRAIQEDLGVSPV